MKTGKNTILWAGIALIALLFIPAVYALPAGVNNLEQEGIPANSSGGGGGGSILNGSFCIAGQRGNLTIGGVDIDILNRPSNDETQWTLLDKISIELDVENNDVNDIDDVFAEIGLFDASGRNVVQHLNFVNSEEERISLGDIADGDEQSGMFEFIVPPNISDGNYKLKIKAYSADDGEETTCADEVLGFNHSTYQDIRIAREEDEGKAIPILNLQLTPSALKCGEVTHATMDIANIGDGDQDRVKIVAMNARAGINVTFELREGLDIGEERNVQFDILVPSNISSGNYTLAFKTEYDYRNGMYREESQDTWEAVLRVTECGPSLEDRVAALEAKIAELEKRTSKTELALKKLRAEFNAFVERINRFISNLPRGLRGR